MSSLRQEAEETLELTKAISLMLSGRSSYVQGAVLADLLAMWLAGHVVLGDPKKTKRHRQLALKMHLAAVEALIEPNYKMVVEPQLKRMTQ